MSQQVTSHHIQICYLQRMKTTVYYPRYMRFVTPPFVYIPQLGDASPVASFIGRFEETHNKGFPVLIGRFGTLGINRKS